MVDIAKLTELLEKHESSDSQKKRFLGYVDQCIRTKDKQGNSVMDRNSAQSVYSLYAKFHNLGVALDGVNAVITGTNMVMVTAHGYKNKVIATYPESTFDTQLVKQGDAFSLAKESGSVVYTHTFGDPFANNKDGKIIGAYAVIKNSRGEFIETLNEDDYNNMKKGSRQTSLWDLWASEFWLKSVMKRACKRAFYDIVADVDQQDNTDFGIDEEIKSAENDSDEIAAEYKESTARDARVAGAA